MSRAVSFLLLVALTGCAAPRQVKRVLLKTEDTLAMAHKVYAPLCAPEELANAESAVDFAKVEFHQGFVYRSSEHVDYAYIMAKEALDKATPCGTADRDNDTIPDVIDRCPDEAEDWDHTDDEDGCRDIDPYGDEDGDGIKNIDDACVDDPEDFDGHNDEDGCPESSDDKDGDGIIDSEDDCPDEAEDRDGFKDSDGCPDLDNDEDTVPDTRDACIFIPEDLDNWEDDDGCPDPDNDLDGIPDQHDDCPNEPGDRLHNGCPSSDRDGDGIGDANDKCPDKPETVNNYLDSDGCPDAPPTGVKVTKKVIEVDGTILFETGKARLLPESFSIIDKVYQVMIDAPDLRVRVEGHTDSQGSDASNMRLSQDRAESVRVYLQSKGIDTSRLRAEGFGETRPIDTNRTAEGRQNNRRVEFHILQDDE